MSSAAQVRTRHSWMPFRPDDRMQRQIEPRLKNPSFGFPTTHPGCGPLYHPSEKGLPESHAHRPEPRPHRHRERVHGATGKPAPRHCWKVGADAARQACLVKKIQVRGAGAPAKRWACDMGGAELSGQVHGSGLMQMQQWPGVCDHDVHERFFAASNAHSMSES